MDNCSSTTCNIRNLRSSQQANAEKRPDLSTRITLTLHDTWTSFMLILSSSMRQESNSTCKFYGHVIGSTNWSGAYPKCSDCGVLIDDPKMLRGSAVRKAEEAKMQWRKYVDNKLVAVSDFA